MQEARVERTSSVVVVNEDDSVWVCWWHRRRVELTHAGRARALSLLLQATAGTAGLQHSCSPGFVSARGAVNVCCVPYALFQQEVVRERATSFVTVAALNRK